MLRRQFAAALTVLGGAFYVLGGFLGSSLFTALSWLPGGGSAAETGASDVFVAFLVWGLVSGACIMVGGAWLNSENKAHRRVAGIGAIVVMLLGALPTLGGLGVGFILVLSGSILGLTYRPPNLDRWLFTDSRAGPRSSPAISPSLTSGRVGTTKQDLCARCGVALLEGAVSCGICGSPGPDAGFVNPSEPMVL